MIFDAYAFVEKLESEVGQAATSATFATQHPKNRANVADVADVAGGQGQKPENVGALDNAMDQASERAAIMEYDGGLSRRDAEHAAAQAASERWGVPVAVILEGMKS